MLLHGLGGFIVDVFISDLYDLSFGDSGHQRHIRRSVPVLPCRVVRLDLRRLRVVLPDLLGGEIDAVRIKDLQAPFLVVDVPVDQGGVELLGFVQKQLILECVVLCCEQVFFVGLAFLDDGAALPDLAVLAGDFLLCPYLLAELIIEHAGGDTQGGKDRAAQKPLQVRRALQPELLQRGTGEGPQLL